MLSRTIDSSQQNAVLKIRVGRSELRSISKDKDKLKNIFAFNMYSLYSKLSSLILII